MTRIMLTVTDMTKPAWVGAAHTFTVASDDDDELVRDIGREAERLAEKIIKGRIDEPVEDEEDSE